MGSSQVFNDVALLRAYPLPTGEVNTFFATMVAKSVDHKHHNERLRHFINKDNVKAVMSMGDAWKRAGALPDNSGSVTPGYICFPRTQMGHTVAIKEPE